MAIRRNLSQPLAESTFDEKEKKTTKTRKNILTGRTKTITKTTDAEGRTTKAIEKKRKDGTLVKTKTKYKGVKGDSTKKVKTTSTYDKQGKAKKSKYIEVQGDNERTVMKDNWKTGKTSYKVDGKERMDKKSVRKQVRARRKKK
tara:strand:- start:71 stop:502 length:432 start_codon:yes stop_codon:yes gene_type:complete